MNVTGQSLALSLGMSYEYESMIVNEWTRSLIGQTCIRLSDKYQKPFIFYESRLQGNDGYL